MNNEYTEKELEFYFEKLFPTKYINNQREFLREQILYYETIKKDEYRNLITEKFIYKYFDSLEKWAIKNNKEIINPDLKFLVKGWNN